MIVSSIQGRIRFLDENIKKIKVEDKINKSLESLEGIEKLTGNGIIKYALYSVLGVQGYKKGKGMMQGKGRKNSR